jgi:hypothetical protein
MTVGLLSDFAMEAAAGIANGKRRPRFFAHLNTGYSGPRLLAQGDSWFCYPHEALLFIAAPKDAIWQLGQEMAVVDVALPGARTWQYLEKERFEATLKELDALAIDVLLLSGGGNDLVRDNMLSKILPGGDRPPATYLGAPFQELVASAVNNLERLIRAAIKQRPNLKIVLNGYSYAFPRPGGQWFGGPMSAIGIPVVTQKKVADLIAQRYAAALGVMVHRINSQLGKGDRIAILADTLDSVPDKMDWYDELHPKDKGFAGVAKQLRRAVLKVHPLVG